MGELRSWPYYTLVATVEGPLPRMGFYMLDQHCRWVITIHKSSRAYPTNVLVAVHCQAKLRAHTSECICVATGLLIGSKGGLGLMRLASMPMKLVLQIAGNMVFAGACAVTHKPRWATWLPTTTAMRTRTSCSSTPMRLSSRRRQMLKRSCVPTSWPWVARCGRCQTLPCIETHSKVARILPCLHCLVMLRLLRAIPPAAGLGLDAPGSGPWAMDAHACRASACHELGS